MKNKAIVGQVLSAEHIGHTGPACGCFPHQGCPQRPRTAFSTPRLGRKRAPALGCVPGQCTLDRGPKSSLRTEVLAGEAQGLV